jgi:adenylate cyclase
LAAADRLKQRRKAGSLFARLGVRWRLLLAFLRISAFAVIAAAAGLYSFAEVGKMLGRITEERVPSALASLEVSRQAARIVAAAPALLAVTSNDELREVSGSIAGEVTKLEESLGDLKGSEIHPAALAAIEPAVDGLQRNFFALDALIANRLAIADRREQLLQQLSSTNIATQRLVAPGILVMDSKIGEWRRTNSDPSFDEKARGVATAKLGQEIATFLPHQKAQIELSAINDGLLKAASAETAADLPLLVFPLRRSIFTLEALASEFDEKLRPRLVERINAFKALIDGADSILEARQNELAVIEDAKRLLDENAALSRELTGSVDRLVGSAKEDIATANADALSVQRLSSGVLIAVVVLSLACSALIVWLYVGRNLIARLTALSGSMLAIAGGDLRAPLPPAGGRDEIGRMAEALTVFRDTAVEVEEKNLRDLHAVLETIDYGVLMLEPDLRVRVHNRAFCELAGMPPASVAGRPHFRDVLEHNQARGIYGVPEHEWNAYVRQRIEEIQEASALPSEWRLADGRTLEYRCVPLPDGGRMLTYYDLTHLKRIEEASRAAKSKPSSRIARSPNSSPT